MSIVADGEERVSSEVLVVMTYHPGFLVLPRQVIVVGHLIE